MQRIGFIGLGAMGAPMAQRIQDQRASAPLVVHARRKESATAALRAGAVWAESPADLAGHVDVVVTMLPDLPDLREVIYASGGLRSEEHTSELQSRGHLVCRLLLEKK